MSLQAPIPQSEIKCEDCEHFELDLDCELCRECYNCPAKHNFQERMVENETPNARFVKMDGEDCGECTPEMFS